MGANPITDSPRPGSMATGLKKMCPTTRSHNTATSDTVACAPRRTTAQHVHQLGLRAAAKRLFVDRAHRVMIGRRFRANVTPVMHSCVAYIPVLLIKATRLLSGDHEGTLIVPCPP